MTDYFVFLITGTDDFAYSYDTDRAENMRKSADFKENDTMQDGNFAYRVKEGYSHDGKAAAEYTYNGMLFFFGPSDGAGSGSQAMSGQETGQEMHQE